MITDEKKEEVRLAADIVEVVSDYVKLKRSGSRFVGLCPFHNEKTPSFYVTPGLGIYKCFGCGEGGDVFNFVMEMEGVGFNEAVRSLGQRFGVIIPEDDTPEYDEQYKLKEGIYHALRYAGLFFYRHLNEEEGKKARDYLQKRGFKTETIKKYGLGFAPGSWDDLYKTATKEGINEKYLLEAGLIKSGKNGEEYYDTFRNRLMFPIFNPSGKVIAFGGRNLGDAKGAKYINSPQTKVYNKSEVLYGIQAAKNEIRKEGEAILVEGYTDVLSLHQAGIRNTVSTSGTSLTPDQMRVLHRYGEKLLMIYDADSAGQTAMARGLNIALSEGLQVRMMELPEGEDPDSFIRRFGTGSFIEYKKKHAKDFITFLFDKEAKSGNLDDPIQKKEAVDTLIRSIAHIRDQISVDTFIQHLSRLSGIGDRRLFEELKMVKAELAREEKRQKEREHRSERSFAGKGENKKTDHGQEKATGTDKPVNPKNEVKTIDYGRIPGFEKEIIRLMLEYGRKMVEYIGAHCNEDYFEGKEMRAFFEDIILRYQDGGEISVETYAGREHPYPALVSEIVTDLYTISEKGTFKRGVDIRKDTDPYLTAKKALHALKISYLQRLKDEFRLEYASADQGKKVDLSRMIKEIGYEQSRLRDNKPELLFPDPPDANPESEDETRGDE